MTQPGTDEGIAARDAAITNLDAATSQQTKIDADRIIASFAVTGQPFSANETRSFFDLAQIPTAARGSAFLRAIKTGLIVRVGFAISTDKGTHGKTIATYTGTTTQHSGEPEGQAA